MVTKYEVFLTGYQSLTWIILNMYFMFRVRAKVVQTNRKWKCLDYRPGRTSTCGKKTSPGDAVINYKQLNNQVQKTILFKMQLLIVPSSSKMYTQDRRSSERTKYSCCLDVQLWLFRKAMKWPVLKKKTKRPYSNFDLSLSGHCLRFHSAHQWQLWTCLPVFGSVYSVCGLSLWT